MLLNDKNIPLRVGVKSTSNLQMSRMSIEINEPFKIELIILSWSDGLHRGLNKGLEMGSKVGAICLVIEPNRI